MSGRHGWRIIHDIEFDGCDVRHVVVGPGGVYAIETTNTSFHWSLRSTRDEEYLAEAVDHARFAARKVQLLLADVAAVPVTPVLVCRGPGIGDVGGGKAVRRGVLVVTGGEAQRLLQDEGERILDHVTVDCIARRLETYARPRDSAVAMGQT